MLAGLHTLPGRELQKSRKLSFQQMWEGLRNFFDGEKMSFVNVP